MSQDRLIIERDVEASMRDGTVLRANVFRPDVDEPLPTLLCRTPYGKDAANVDFCMLSAARGYAAVVQDTRGRWASEGVCRPMEDEFQDGYDTVEWVAGQPWCNGKVGMWGGSYVGWTQWTAAAMRPEALKAIFPMVAIFDPYRDVAYPGGAPALGVLASWNLRAIVQMEIQRLDAPPEEKAALRENLVDAVDRLTSGETFRTLPLRNLPLMQDPRLGCGYQEMLEHETKDAFWQKMDIHNRINEIAVPAYHVGGWYDIFSQGNLANYQRVCDGAATEEARQGQKLIMGPWVHGVFNNVNGEIDFGMRASGEYLIPYNIIWRWYDYWLKGEDNGILDEAPVRIFVMGRNTWRDEAEWPLARAVDTPYYLQSGGDARTLHGDGTLSTTRPDGAAAESDTFVYDPRDPTPTRGGGLCCHEGSLRAGAFDQRPVEEREDVLVFTSERLAEDLEVTGPIKVVLWAASSAVDTDFTAKLVDVGPDGYARNLCDGILRVQFRDGFERGKPLQPGAVYRLEIDLGGTSNVFMAGHRIRLEISSSNFPRFARNPNTGHRVEHEDEMVTAEQTVYHSARHASHVVLPVVPLGPEAKEA